MKKYIYMFEVQKPTGTHRFIKVTEEIFVVNKVEVNPKHKFEQKLFNDRVENYTYLGEIDKETWPELLNYFYCLVKEYDESLEYTRDNYVYLIPKKGREPGIRIGHRLPQKLVYDSVKPIPFFPEKDEEDEEEIDTHCSICTDGINSERWYTYFYKKVSELLAFYHCRHTITYVYFEAFILTYNQYYKENRNEKDKIFYLLQLTDEPVSLMTLYPQYIPDEDYYTCYIKTTFNTFNLPYGEFYCNVDKEQIVRLYMNFIKAIQK